MKGWESIRLLGIESLTGAPASLTFQVQNSTRLLDVVPIAHRTWAVVSSLDCKIYVDFGHFLLPLRSDKYYWRPGSEATLCIKIILKAPTNCSMVFGISNTTKLQNDVFCLTEERDYFQAKFLEQVSEIASLKEELQKSKKEIARLRLELMEQGSSQPSRNVVDYGDSKPPQHRLQEEKKDDVDDGDDASTISSLHADEQDDDDSAKDIRQSAEKLLQWASYRSVQRTAPSTPEHSSVSTPRVSSKESLLDQITRSIQSIGIDKDQDDYIDDDDDDYDDHNDDDEIDVDMDDP